MKYVSDDYLQWDTFLEAKDADELFELVRTRINQFKAKCREEKAKIEKEFPHIQITSFDETEVNWSDKRRH